MAAPCSDPCARGCCRALRDIVKVLWGCVPGWIVRVVAVHADGNRASKSEAGRHRVRFTDVNHSHMEFTKATAGHRLLSGTQLLDQVWRHLKIMCPSL